MNALFPVAPPAAVPDDAYDALAARFRPIFAEIAEGAVAREQERALAHDAVARLAAAGFGALRVPVDQGGGGIGLTQLFRLLIELGEAESNLPQILRAHFGFVEGQRAALRDGAAPWLKPIAEGAVFGGAMSEKATDTGMATALTRDGEGWRLNGTKYYSTGAVYADWIAVAAAEGGDMVSVVVKADAPGVTRIDDWDGFGQRLTGSGTTRFENVRVEDTQIAGRRSFALYPLDPFLHAYVQLFHLAELSGIARAALRDTLAFVLPRRRSFGVQGELVPRHDPIVQRVVGRLSSLVASAEVLTVQAASALERVEPFFLDGDSENPAVLAAEIAVFQAQQIVLEQVLEATTLLFEVGGASATSEHRRLDRHWRNARTVASHNPAEHRARTIGDYVLNGTPASAIWTRAGKPA